MSVPAGKTVSPRMPLSEVLERIEEIARKAECFNKLGDAIADGKTRLAALQFLARFHRGEKPAIPEHDPLAKLLHDDDQPHASA